jgi:hypothetical protein
MVDIYLNPVTNDIDITNSRITLTNTRKDNTRQRLHITLNAFKGEWFRNINYGIPYLENDNNSVQLLEKNTKDLLDLEIRSAILNTDGIEELISYTSSLNSDRVLTITFIARLADGSSIQLQEEL